jgi:thioesterase domain-containing protein
MLMGEVLTCLKKGSGSNIVVFFHPISGSIIPYIGLAFGVDADVSVYAMCDPVVMGSKEYSVSVVARSKQYAGLILDRFPNAVPVLCSWSMGGIYALEVARVYHQLGKSFNLLMIDSCLDLPWGDERRSVLTEQKKLEYFLQDILESKSISYDGKEEIKSFDQCVEVLTQEYKVNMTKEGIDQLYILFQAFSENCKALSGYNPEVFEGFVNHLVAKDGNENVFLDNEKWGEYLTKNSSFRQLGGNHYTILKNAFIVSELTSLIPSAVKA